MMWINIKEKPPESVYVLLYLPELEKDISFPGHAFMIATQPVWNFDYEAKMWYKDATHWMHITPDGWRDIIEDPPHPESSSILITKGLDDNIIVSNSSYPVMPEHIKKDKITKWKPIPPPPGYVELCDAKSKRLGSPKTFFYELSEYDRG